MKYEKGKYYRIIFKIIGCSIIGDTAINNGVRYMYNNQIEEIYETIPRYFEDIHIIDKEEFIFSMRWVLADVFGNGCEAEESEGMFDFLKEELIWKF